MTKTELLEGTLIKDEETMQEKATPWYVLNSPEIGGPFQDFFKACKETGVLDKKTKELLMVALTSMFHCPQLTDKYIQAALEEGVTREEITEALLIAAVAAADTQLNGRGCPAKIS